jgi:hypothetical protein
MYWIYLIIFSFIVFIPSIITSGHFGLSMVETQEYSILLIGIVTFIIFNFRERIYSKNLSEKSNVVKQANRMSRELTHSYSYIGEINRKLDILQNVTAGFPETSQLPTRRKTEIYDSIMEAIHLLSKSNDFALRFVNEKNHDILKELRSKENKNISLHQKEYLNRGYFFETEEFIFARSPKSIDNIYACIIIRKKSGNQRSEDPDILKALAMQALFLFMFIQEKFIQDSNVHAKGLIEKNS